MVYAKFEYYLSSARLSRFQHATNQDISKTVKLYRINLRASQAFYPLLNLFEIFLRNAIDQELKNWFSDPHWILTQKTGFMSHAKLRKSKFFLRSSVENAEKKLQRKRGEITSAQVLAEQHFGFWTSLFEPHHYQLIGGRVIHCFSYKPSYANRVVIAKKLNEIRGFRNRIYHNEPICFNGQKVSFAQASKVRDDIMELTGWMNPSLKKYLAYFDSIDSKSHQVNQL